MVNRQFLPCVVQSLEEKMGYWETLEITKNAHKELNSIAQAEFLV